MMGAFLTSYAAAFCVQPRVAFCPFCAGKHEQSAAMGVEQRKPQVEKMNKGD